MSDLKISYKKLTMNTAPNILAEALKKLDLSNYLGEIGKKVNIEKNKVSLELENKIQGEIICLEAEIVGNLSLPLRFRPFKSLIIKKIEQSLKDIV